MGDAIWNRWGAILGLPSCQTVVASPGDRWRNTGREQGDGGWAEDAGHRRALGGLRLAGGGRDGGHDGEWRHCGGDRALLRGTRRVRRTVEGTGPDHRER